MRVRYLQVTASDNAQHSLSICRQVQRYRSAQPRQAAELARYHTMACACGCACVRVSADVSTPAGVQEVLKEVVAVRAVDTSFADLVLHTRERPAGSLPSWCASHAAGLAGTLVRCNAACKQLLTGCYGAQHVPVLYRNLRCAGRSCRKDRGRRNMRQQERGIMGPVVGQVPFAGTIKQDPTTCRNGRQAGRQDCLAERG